MEKLITPKEAAQILGICTRTLSRHVARGEIAYIKLGQGVQKPRRMFHPDDLAAFIDARRRQDFPPAPYEGRRRKPKVELHHVIDFTALRADRAEKKMAARSSRKAKRD